MPNWFTTAPIQVPDNADKPATILYGPHGEALVLRQPRSIGFRPPGLGEQLEDKGERNSRPTPPDVSA